MFAIFNKNEFKGWWCNSRHDLSWIGLTVSSLGLKPEDVDVIRFDALPSPEIPFRFNDEKELVTLNKVPDTFDEDQNPTSYVYEAGAKYVGEAVYSRGHLRHNLEP